MHCLATYLDSQLPAFTDRPDRRPFTGQYLVRCPEKPQPTSHPLIVEVQLNPPHYKLVLGPDEYELPKVHIWFKFEREFLRMLFLPGPKQHAAYSDTFLLVSQDKI